MSSIVRVEQNKVGRVKQYEAVSIELVRLVLVVKVE